MTNTIEGAEIRNGFTIRPSYGKGDVEIRSLKDMRKHGITNMNPKFLMDSLAVGKRANGELVDLHPCAPKNYRGIVAEDGWPQESPKTT